MQVKQIKVSGFRGINSLNWVVDGTMVGLIGPGDSTKTTILDAIDFALSARWSLPLHDADFYGGKAVSPIMVETTVGGIPNELTTDEKFGLYIRGWKGGALLDEPDDDSEPVLTIRLTITPDFEASWLVVTDRQPEGKPISWHDRARLGAVRLGAEVERDLTWARGSSLSRLTGDLGLEGVIAEAYRAARAAVDNEQLPKLVTAATSVTTRARMLGATPSEDLRPALDPATISVHSGALSLHDGFVPVRAAGLGTRRLVSLAIQQAVVKDGAILLIDEIEHALEPHRIRRLIRRLRTAIQGGNDQSQAGHGQVIVTTHSPVAVVELSAAETRVVRSCSGVTEVLAPDLDLQGVIRAVPHALLGKRIVVCEGATEVGLCWGMEPHWQLAHSGESTACRGVVFVDGGGSEAPKRARCLSALGYQIAYFADSDRLISPTGEELTQAGICVIRWQGQVSTEKRIFLDLPWEFVQQAFNLAIEEHGSESVVAAAACQLKLDPRLLSENLSSWASQGIDGQEIRKALGSAAKGCGRRPPWYKRTDRAARLADILHQSLPRITTSDLCAKLSLLENWCYA